MPQAFIVRPFGTRPVLKKKPGSSSEYETVLYDFDKVENELVRPAMRKTGLSGGTTGEVFAAGDIREDMFSSLLVDDLIIADITIHNANVFYELGIRHALRDRCTILIKCAGYDETPFDIIGYRYIEYNKDDPGKALDALVQAINETLDPVRPRKDSPVFNVLPALQPQDPELFMAVPEDFCKEVAQARSTADIGWLSLLKKESENFSWSRPAFRLIGDGYFQAKAYPLARPLFEEIVNSLPKDRHANDRLATIYQRLAEEESEPKQREALLSKSDVSIENLLNNNNLSNTERAEALALKARNAKIRWLFTWKDLSDPTLRQKNALKSLDLKDACNLYTLAFREDLNHFYSGINALALLYLTIQLAEIHPDVWKLRFDRKTDPVRALQDLKAEYEGLLAAEDLSIQAHLDRAARANPPVRDVWAEITQADFLCMTSDDPQIVGYHYQQATRDVKEQNKEAIVRQLQIYQLLGVLPENVTAAIDNISRTVERPKYILVFTGHMIDRKDRPEPRFPAAKELEVRQQILNAITLEKNRLGNEREIVGIAGGACGGDILFHEVCSELGIPTSMYLAKPTDQFVVDSVKFAEGDWLLRFNKLTVTLPCLIINDKGTLPNWLRPQKGYTVWARNNLWKLHTALALGGKNVTIFALWNGKDGEGPGGTKDMVDKAQAASAYYIQIPI